MDEVSAENDDARYEIVQACREREWEAKCNRCGACCGITEGDPCENLQTLPDNKYSCRIYDNRFGMHKTISGKAFRCVPLRWIINQHWDGDHLCAYKENPSIRLETGDMRPETKIS